METHVKFMKEAYKEALKAYNENEVPVGCVLVYNGKIIARAHNKKEQLNSVINHAEIQVIQKASKKMRSWRLEDCDLYVTLQPCMMCSGAIYQSRIKNVYFGTEQKTDYFKLSDLNWYPNVVGGVLANECQDLLLKFFKEKRGDRSGV